MAEFSDFKEYLLALQRRIKQLDEDSLKAMEAEHIREEVLDRINGELSRTIQSLGEEVKRLEHGLRSQMADTERLVHALKQSVREHEYTHLRSQIDRWQGEQFLTRDAFRRMLSQSF